MERSAVLHLGGADDGLGRSPTVRGASLTTRPG
jgi:hypothetical protein